MDAALLRAHHHQTVLTLVPVLRPASKDLALALTVSPPTALSAVHTLNASKPKTAHRRTAPDLDARQVTAYMLHPPA